MTELDPITVPVVAEIPQLAAAAHQLAVRWNLPEGQDIEHASFVLVLTGERLELRQDGLNAPGPVFVDFIGGAVGHRRRFGGGRGQPLAKAVGLKGGENPRVLDATAGLGRDAFVLACLGSAVTLVERSPVVAALLEDGLLRAESDAEVGPVVQSRMHLRHGDAVAVMQGLEEGERPDVVYLDPMFPERQKSALVKKEMRAFHEVVGADPDADRLLEAALVTARKRVVVKRPDHAPWLAETKPTLSIPTKNHRFDIYVVKVLANNKQD